MSMEGIDRTENLHRVERTGSQQQRRRRMTDEEFKEYLEREKDNPEGGLPREKETPGEQPSVAAHDSLSRGLDILDIRLRSVRDLRKIEPAEITGAHVNLATVELEDTERPPEKPEEKPDKRIDTIV